jgi:hypothetical protein
MRTSLDHPWATARKGKQIISSMRWKGLDTTRSTGPSRVNLKASWIASTFSSLRKA